MPSEGGAYAFGDVVLVPFPFTSQAASKQPRRGRLQPPTGSNDPTSY